MIEDGLTDVLAEEGIGTITFSPLAQGLLTINRYLHGIPEDSRAHRSDSPFLTKTTFNLPYVAKQLNDIKRKRGRHWQKWP